MSESVRTIALLVSYLGMPFRGYAKQPQCRTVQGELEAAWSELSGESVNMLASGRTDAGVHAHGQVVHFHTTMGFDAERIGSALNSKFGEDLVIRESVEMDSAFHSSESAQLKHYIYRIATGSTPPVLDNLTCEWVPQQLNIAAMREACEYFIGTHDYQSCLLYTSDAADE